MFQGLHGNEQYRLSTGFAPPITDPATVPDLRVHYRGDSLVTGTATNVTAWGDLEGNANLAGGGPAPGFTLNDPRFNNQTSIQVSTNPDEFIENTTFQILAPADNECTMICVECMETDTSTGTGWDIAGYLQTGWRAFTQNHGFSTPNQVLGAWATITGTGLKQANVSLLPSVMKASVPYVYTNWVDNAVEGKIKCYKNTGDVAFAETAIGGTLGNGFNVGAGLGITLFSNISGGISNAYNVAEMMVWNRALTETELTGVWNYLADRYGIDLST